MRLPTTTLGLIQGLRGGLTYLDQRIQEVDVTMKILNRQNDACKRLMTVPGIGELNASAFPRSGELINFATAVISPPGSAWFHDRTRAAAKSACWAYQ